VGDTGRATVAELSEALAVSMYSEPKRPKRFQSFFATSLGSTLMPLRLSVTPPAKFSA
jgi:hypothetical protein